MAVFKSENRRVQAHALFAMCDVDGDNRIGKLEFLKFINQGIDKVSQIRCSAAALSCAGVCRIIGWW